MALGCLEGHFSISATRDPGRYRPIERVLRLLVVSLGLDVLALAG
jgi:hypothetical protein